MVDTYTHGQFFGQRCKGNLMRKWSSTTNNSETIAYFCAKRGKKNQPRSILFTLYKNSLRIDNKLKCKNLKLLIL